MSTTSPRYALRDVEFIKEPEYTLGQLVALELQNENEIPVRWNLESLQRGVGGLVELARTIRHLETHASPGFSEQIPVRLIDEEGKAYPLSCIHFYERIGFKENRSQHEWLLWADAKGLHLSFEHGNYGRRVEHFNTLSATLYRLASVLAKRVSWRSFGDERSRLGLLHKGQFYWQDQRTGNDVPVDNFIFASTDGRQLRLSGVSGEAVLGYTATDGSSTYEWFDDYAEALRRMADVHAGLVDLTQFGQEGRPSTHAQAAGKRTLPVAEDVVTSGRFVVKSIYQSDDEHPAPALIFKTAEGKWVRLLTSDTRWIIQVNTAASQGRGTLCAPTHQADALRLLAAILEGSASKRDLTSVR